MKQAQMRNHTKWSRELRMSGGVGVKKAQLCPRNIDQERESGTKYTNKANLKKGKLEQRKDIQ